MPSRSRRIAVIPVLWLALGICSPAEAQSDKIFTHDWQRSDTSPPAVPRIDEADSVSVRIDNFNFLNYTVQLTVTEQKLEAYQHLEKLWSKLLGLGGITAPAGERGGLTPALLDFRAKMQEIEEHISTVSGNLPNTHVTPDEKLSVVAPGRARLQALDGRLDEAKQKVESLLVGATEAEMSLYLDSLESYRTVKEKIAAFNSAVELINNGFLKVIGKKEPGTRVTVTMVAVDEDRKEIGAPQTFQYFVHGDLPVTAHAGYTYSTLDDLEFEQVRIDDDDLFAMTDDQGGTQSIALFLSLPLHAWGENDSWSVLGTLGTGVQDPGDVILLGPSLRYKRLFITAGASTSEVQQADESTRVTMESTMKDGAEDRTFFADTFEDRDWALFFSISFGLFEF